MPKTCEKPYPLRTLVVLCKEPLEKKTKYVRNETILKIGRLAKAIAHGKDVPFHSLEKNTKYSRNETILKIGYHAKSIAHGKWAVWRQKKFQKHVKIHFTNHFEVFCGKNRWKKH